MDGQDYLQEFLDGKLLRGIRRKLKGFTDKDLVLSMSRALAKTKSANTAKDSAGTLKAIWCMEQVAQVHASYLDAFQFMKDANFYAGWRELDRTLTELHFLDQHFISSQNDEF